MEHYGISVEPERRSTLPAWDPGYKSRLIYSEETNTLYYGSDVNWVTISGGGGGGGGTSIHSLLSGLDYGSAGHTGFAQTSHSHTESNISDLDKYTESEVDTISGTLSSEIDSDITTHTNNSDAHHNESHTVLSHSDTSATGANLNELVGSGDTTLHKHDGQYYTEAEVDDLITTISGKLDDHNELNNLDYASSGHIGFQPEGDYATDSELTTVSGDLQTYIDGKSDVSHLHDDRYYTESEVDTISGTLQTNIDATLLNVTLSGFHAANVRITGNITGVLGQNPVIRKITVYINSDPGANHNEQFRLSLYNADEYTEDQLLWSDYFNLIYQEVKVATVGGGVAADIDLTDGFVKYDKTRFLGGTPETVGITAITDTDTLAITALAAGALGVHAVDTGVVKVYEYTDMIQLVDADASNEIHIALENIGTVFTGSTDILVAMEVQ